MAYAAIFKAGELVPTIGDNEPPGPIDAGKEAMTELSAFLRENPVIQSPEDAKHGGAWVERTRIALADMETERKAQTEPINKKLSAINSAYKAVREPLESALKLLRARLTKYATDVEAARIAEANRLRAEAEAAEAAAREAERLEQNAEACAAVGECADVGAAIKQADDAFKQFGKADRQAAVAERNVPVKLGSVMGGKALSMKTRRVLVVTDAAAAVVAMGLTDKIKTAIVQSAKDFEDAHGELPAGVTETYERSM
jgi:hypothetical protein